jgi:hypothetical protein
MTRNNVWIHGVSIDMNNQQILSADKIEKKSLASFIDNQTIKKNCNFDLEKLGVKISKNIGINVKFEIINAYFTSSKQIMKPIIIISKNNTHIKIL